MVRMRLGQRLEEVEQVTWDSYVVCGTKLLASTGQSVSWGCVVETRSMSLVGYVVEGKGGGGGGPVHFQGDSVCGGVQCQAMLEHA